MPQPGFEAREAESGRAGDGPVRFTWRADVAVYVLLASAHRALLLLPRALGLLRRWADDAAKRVNDLQYRWSYRVWARMAADTHIYFMNFGVKARDGEEVGLPAADEPDRLSIQLYHEVVAGTDLRGKDVLEVSSGHGGGARYIARTSQPARMVGLDLTPAAVAMCRRQHHESGLEFLVGNAVALPFDDCTFDAVISVEASHRYPSFDAFVGEVERVLRPGGRFLFADLRWRVGELEAMQQSLEVSGLDLLESEDVTGRVLRSLHEYGPSRRALVTATLPRPFWSGALDGFGVPGTPIYQAFESGTAGYMRFVMRKPSS